MVIPHGILHSGDQGQCAVRIINLGMQIFGNRSDILLKACHIRESPVADLLEDVAAAGGSHHKVGHIDMATAITLAGNGLGIQPELFQNMNKQRIHRYHFSL